LAAGQPAQIGNPAFSRKHWLWLFDFPQAVDAMLGATSTDMHAACTKQQCMNPHALLQSETASPANYTTVGRFGSVLGGW